MAYNYAKAEIEFLAMWEKKSAEYREAGMDENSIAEMYKLEREIFLSDRRWEEHRSESLDIPLTVSFSEEDFSGRYAWVETLENADLAREIKRLKRDDLELLTMIVEDQMNVVDISRMLKVNHSTVSRKLSRLKKYLKNFSENGTD